MSFNSLAYLIFLPITVLLFWLLPKKIRPYFLLLASYICYGYYSFYLIFLMLFTTLVSYLGCLGIEKSKTNGQKKAVFITSVALILLLLFVFKYLDFAYQNVVSLLSLFGVTVSTKSLSLILPIGISFFSFQTLSYVIDVYKGKFLAEKNFFYYALFVSFFPQLVAGPIERPEDLLPQLLEDRKFDKEYLFNGFQFLTLGFVKKVVIADFLAIFVDSIYSNLNDSSGVMILLASMLFYFQIYSDFSGYSDIAKGSAALIGVKLTENFDQPYRSLSLTEFWRRWHITLSSWLRDYIYIPLGGSRKGKIKKYRNLMIVFLASGLWHGANWTYVIWGLLNGLILVLEDVLSKPLTTLSTRLGLPEGFKKVGKVIYAFLLVSVLWIFFRSQSVEEIGICFTRIFTSFIAGSGYSFFSDYRNVIYLLFAVALVFLLPYLPSLSIQKNKEKGVSYLPSTALLYVSLVFLISFSWLYLLETKGESGFIYFQF